MKNDEPMPTKEALFVTFRSSSSVHTVTPRSVRVAFLLLAALLAGRSLATDLPNSVQGSGVSVCAEYVAIARSEAPRLVANYENWVLGYLSGANAMLTALNPRYNVLGFGTPVAIQERLRVLCMAPENSNRQISSVAMQILRELEAKLKASGQKQLP